MCVKVSAYFSNIIFGMSLLCCKLPNTVANLACKKFNLQFSFLYIQETKRKINLKHKLINDILYSRYTKCCSDNTRPNGAMPQEETLFIK